MLKVRKIVNKRPAGGGGGASPALKFNVASNSQYTSLVGL